jgi:hypothetical protein
MIRSEAQTPICHSGCVMSRRPQDRLHAIVAPELRSFAGRLNASLFSSLDAVSVVARCRSQWLEEGADHDLPGRVVGPRGRARREVVGERSMPRRPSLRRAYLKTEMVSEPRSIHAKRPFSVQA